eukprot:365995-Chlamydomonas_euryale.AAC.12
MWRSRTGPQREASWQPRRCGCGMGAAGTPVACTSGRILRPSAFSRGVPLPREIPHRAPLRSCRRRHRAALAPAAFLTRGGGGGSAGAAPNLKLTLNTASLIGRREGGGSVPLVQPGSLQSRLQLLGRPELSKATRRARRKVLRVLLENLNGPGQGPEAAVARPPEGGSGGVVVELVLADTAVADFSAALTLMLESGQEQEAAAAGTAFLRARQQGLSGRLGSNGGGGGGGGEKGRRPRERG